MMLNKLALLLVVCAKVFSTSGFGVAVVRTRTLAGRTTSLSAMTCPDIAEGEREILETSDGKPVLVTKVAGSYYAVDATCPHLGLPMKKGKINVEGGTPTLTCNFHNSCFELESGKCTKWVTGALGFKVGVVAGIMNKVGGKQQDIKAYSVTQKEDGSLLIE